MSIIPNSTFDIGFQTGSGSQIAADPFTAGVNTFSYSAPSEILVGEGTTLFNGAGGGTPTFVAYENVTFSDTTPPETSIASGPSGAITQTSATFTFTGSDDATPEPDLVYASRLDPLESTFSAFSSSTSRTFSGLSPGDYTFQVKARDQTGNEDPTPATRSFTVGVPPDIFAPETIITGGPSGTITETSVTFTFTATDDVTPVENLVYSCRLNPVELTFSAFSSSTSCSFSNLITSITGERIYTLHVKARDEAGNEDLTPAQRTFTLSGNPPTTPPETTITGGPSGTITATSATFTFTASSGVNFIFELRFQSRLDPLQPDFSFTNFTPVLSRTYSDLAPGDYTFFVRASDDANRIDPTPASRSFTVLAPPRHHPAGNHDYRRSFRDYYPGQCNFHFYRF